MSIFERVEYRSNHGTDKGILPRFYYQIREIAEHGTQNKEEFEKKMTLLFNNNLQDFTSFYDLFEEITSIYEDYNNGSKNGKYFFRDEQKVIVHNRQQEVVLNQKIKSFFIDGKQIINNLGKSGILDDQSFVLTKYLFVKDTTFQKEKTILLNFTENKRYQILVDYIQQTKAEFLTLFLEIRDKFEHKNYRVNGYQVDFDSNNQVRISEPNIEGYNSYSLIEVMYNNILVFSESIMVLFFGIHAVYKHNGFMALYRRKTFNLKELICEYVVLPKHNNENLELILG